MFVEALVRQAAVCEDRDLAARIACFGQVLSSMLILLAWREALRAPEIVIPPEVRICLRRVP